MCRQPLRLCLSVGLLFVTLWAPRPAMSEEPASDPERQAIIDARNQAEAHIANGDLVSAGDVLAKSLRGLNEKRPELIDTAYGNIQLTLFLMEYLMSDEVSDEFTATCLRPDECETDLLLLVAYNIFIGQETPGKTEAAQQMTQLTASQNVFVRIAAMFCLSDPYFFDEPKFTGQYQALLAKGFPDLEITQWALRYPVYVARAQELNKVEESLALMNNLTVTEELESPTKSTERKIKHPAKSDRFIGILSGAMQDLAAPERERNGLATLCETSATDADWRVRYGAMLIAEPYAKRGYEGQVEDAARALLDREKNPTPDVVRAHLVVAKVTRQALREHADVQRRTVDANQTIRDLLAIDWEENPFDRVLYEEVMKCVRQTAGALAEAGRTAEAIETYRLLAAKYPKSLVADACEMEIALLDAAHPKSE